MALRVHLAMLLIVVSNIQCDARVGSPNSQRAEGLRPSDIVIVTGIGFERYEIVEAARAFRCGEESPGTGRLCETSIQRFFLRRVREGEL